MPLKEHVQELNNLHKSLREMLTSGHSEEPVIHCFLALHSQLHSSAVSSTTAWSYEDHLLDGLRDEQLRLVPTGQEHSLIWILWHLTRVEDVTMNLLIAGQEQVFEREGWLAKTNSPFRHTGNGSGLAMVESLSASVDIHALRAYRVAVGKVTREIVQGLTRGDFKRKVASEHLQRVMDEGAVLPAGQDVVDYWGRRDVAGLLLMPPTRHTIVHWNEAQRLKRLLN